MDIKKLIGKTITEATRLCKASNVPCRVVKVDGEGQIITADFSVQRINFTVVDGKVTETKRG